LLRDKTILASPDGLLDGLADDGRIDEEILDTNGELEITGLLLGLDVEIIGEVITDDGTTILLLVNDGPLDVVVLNDGDGE
jgi:hypothetical protein